MNLILRKYLLLLSLLPAFLMAMPKDTSVFISNTRIDILYPHRNPIACILVLPGWNFPQNDICMKSDFCQKALEQGFILIMPDMQKSIYHSVIFPEMRADRKPFHTIQWLTDTVFPYIRKEFHLLGEGHNNLLFGISTGARGVALVAERTGNLFKAGVALSGDYDQTLMSNDKLMLSYYGSFEDFPDRWKQVDNPNADHKNLKIPLFLIHGEADKIVPFQQTEFFYTSISKSDLKHKMVIVPNAGHDYNFWASQYDAAFEFLKSFISLR